MLFDSFVTIKTGVTHVMCTNVMCAIGKIVRMELFCVISYPPSLERFGSFPVRINYVK